MASAPEDTNDVSYYFRLATEQYADISLLFYLDRCPYSRITARCAGVKNGHFVLRAPLEEVENTQIVWGSAVKGYFSVRDERMTPCSFKSRLARIYNGTPNAIYMILPLPRLLDHNQRRFSRRVTMDPEMAESFGLWHGMLEGGDAENLPQWRWLAPESRFCDFDEISATGLRLDFPEKSPICAKMAVNDPILLKGNFAAGRKPMPIFVLGKIVRIMEREENEVGITSVGCNFITWRKVEDTGGQAWFRADPQEGIGLIAQWISRNFRNVNI